MMKPSLIPALAALLAFAMPSTAAKRCDLLPASTPGGNPACLDLVWMRAHPGTPIRTAGNATRIARDGFTLCKSAFQAASGAEADVVFIYDNSGSMTARFAFVDPARGDTAFYSGAGGCASAAVQGLLSLQTLEGPRSVPLLVSDAGCTERAGDPYAARAAAMRQAIDFLGKSSPHSTGAVIGFTDNLAHLQPPLLLDNPAALAQVKAAMVPDTEGGTRYGPPLRQAALWLTDTAFTRTAKQSVVFISDGAPTDTLGAAGYVNSIYPAIPIYGIFLGDTSASYGRLRDLSSRTGGAFHRVDPGNVGRMNQVMEEIIRAITVTAAPRSIRVTNKSLSPAQASVTVNPAGTDPAGNVHVTLDSILALKQGPNSLVVQIDMGDANPVSYPLQVQADGPEAAQSGSGLACYEEPTLTLLNAGGRPDSAYSAGPSAYDVVLTRSPSELGSVTVMAVGRESTRKNARGDEESILLPVSGRMGGLVTSRRDGFPFQGSATNPAPDNGILEGPSNGQVVLSWAHPRDAREAVTCSLPAASVPTVPGFIAVERVRAVSRGAEIRDRIADPVVIRGGVTLDRVGTDSPMLSSRGCLYNCSGDAIRFSDPATTPTFVFKTASPFAFTVHVYDNLGHAVLKASGSVNASDWESMPKIGDSVAVAMSIIPQTSDGRPAATGAYILRATLSSAGLDKNGPAGPSRITAASRTFVDKFGYVRTTHP